MSNPSVRRHLTQAALPAMLVALFLPGGASAQETIHSAMPPVPTPRSTPCEVRLFQDAPFRVSFREDPSQFTYAPPPGCAPPWAKVVLSMDLTGSRDAQAKGVAMEFKGITLFVGPTTNTAQPSQWHVERDLTDYSALLKSPGSGLLLAMQAFRDSPDTSHVTGSATLRFYPPTAAQPAPRVPDAVFSADTQLLGGPPGGPGPTELDALPHNIERAYLDVVANDHAFWFTCFPDDLVDAHRALFNVLGLGVTPHTNYPQEQGCFNGSYSDVGVTVDDTPAGVAPVFPWLPTDYSDAPVLWNALDEPTDSAQSLGFIPYRVDLTPFAAVLNEAGSHWIGLHMIDHSQPFTAGWYLAPHVANLLVYLDPGRTRVSGAVTYNSLSPDLPQATVTDDLVEQDGVLTGQIRTRMNRDFEIRGFVNTSHGRIHSQVKQTSSFDNVQAIRVQDQVSYRHDLWLESTTESVSRRTRHGELLSQQRTEASYPLELHYVGVGRQFEGDVSYYTDLAGGSIDVDQKRNIDVVHFHHGRPRYRTWLREAFLGGHQVDADTGQDSPWQAAHDYMFQDNWGSCYQKAVITRDGALDDEATGMNCPGDTNHVRWFAHPDGSPDTFSWKS